MNIYLDDRVITFTHDTTAQPSTGEMVVSFDAGGNLSSPWTAFLRNNQIRRLTIVDKSQGKFPDRLPDGFSKSNMESDYPSLHAFFRHFTLLIAAGGLVRNQQGEWLFIHRYGKWDLPKGKLEPQDYHDPRYPEATAKGAIREVMEETGLTKIRLIRPLPSTWHIYEQHEHHILKQTCWYEMFTDAGEPLIPQTSEAIFLARWIGGEKLHCVLHNTYRSLRDFLVPLLLHN